MPDILNYSHEVPMDYLRKGTKAVMVKDGQKILVTVHMDGHFISPNYGRVNNPTRPAPTRNYINLQIEAISSSYRDRVGYTTDSPFHVNDTVYEDSGWTFLVDGSAWSQYQNDLGIMERKLAAKYERVEADLAHAQADLDRARAAMAALRK